MTAGPQHIPEDPSPDAGRRRLHTYGIKEMPAGYDAEVAELFRDLRAASNLTETDLAARIATPVEVVQALEQGAIYALPPWPETCRVVNAYGTLLNLDTRPLLRRIYAQLEAGVVELGPKPVPDVPVMAPQGGNSWSGNHSAPPRQAAPQPQGAPQAPAWPNGGQQPRPQAPQWPGGAPQFPQGGMQGMPQQMPQQAPGQAPWPNGPHGPQAAPQPQSAPPPQAAPQPQAPPAQPQPAQPQAPGYQQPPQGYPAGPQGYQQAPPQGEDATFVGEPAPASGNNKKPALLKWGLGALIASVVLVGLWLALGDTSDSTMSPGASGTSDPVLDPDDPRSRKADRLPSKHF